MELITAKLRNIRELCDISEPGTGTPLKINIPYYQRPYKWKEQHISNLINDFYKNTEEEYFVGAAVTVKGDTDRHDVIDGQQRITTMFLLNYLQFLLIRAYIEELLLTNRTSRVEKYIGLLEEVSKNVFDISYVNQIDKMKKDIMVKFEIIDSGVDEAESKVLHTEIIQLYRKQMKLPEKNLTNSEVYEKAYRKLLEELLSNIELSLKYSRKSYNDKLKTALSKILVIISKDYNPRIEVLDEGMDTLIKQYTDAIRYEFYGIEENLSSEGKDALQYGAAMIESIQKMIENIKFCVIVTGSEKDAYTLFEVLNDRALQIEDLDLIKNLYFKWYCNYSGEDETTIDKTIEKVDRLWVEEIFCDGISKENTKLISFLGTEFFTGDNTIKLNENERYREILEERYLKEQNRYSGECIQNDINVYYMLRLIVKEFELPIRKKAEKVIEGEVKHDKSITYRALQLLNALGQHGVMAALTNKILKKYMIDKVPDMSEEIDIKDFDGYIKELRDDYSNNNSKFKEIHELSFELWRIALMSKNYDLPLQIAKRIIAEINKKSWKEII